MAKSSADTVSRRKKKAKTTKVAKAAKAANAIVRRRKKNAKAVRKYRKRLTTERSNARETVESYKITLAQIVASLTLVLDNDNPAEKLRQVACQVRSDANAAILCDAD